MRTKSLFLGIVISGSFFTASAQSDSAKLVQKVDQLFTTMHMDDIFTDGLTKAIDNQIKSMPALSNYKDDVTAFYTKCISWEAVKPELTKSYLKYYNSDDIDQLIKFYQTPVGKKVASVNIGLRTDIQHIEEQNLQAHISEFQELVNTKVNAKP